MEEMKNVIGRLKNRKSTGIGGVHAEIGKE